MHYHSIATATVIAAVAILVGRTGSAAERAQLRETPSFVGEVAGGPALTAQPPTVSLDTLGTPRDDLQRFFGVYGVAGGHRNFIVAEARAAAGDKPVPPGYLMVGAMWGDVQPWYMRSLSDTRFQQAYVGPYQDAPLVVEFHTDGDGRAVALTFTGMFEDRGRLERIGDLPPEGGSP